MRWLRAISRYRGTTSGGPNFAYDLCVRRAKGPELAGIDLSSWQVAFNGAEPVRPSTLERFAVALAPNGFRAAAAYPCYGLAEATLMASGGSPTNPPRTGSFRAAALERGRAEPGEPGARPPIGYRRPRELAARPRLNLVLLQPGRVSLPLARESWPACVANRSTEPGSCCATRWSRIRSAPRNPPSARELIRRRWGASGFGRTSRA